MAKKKPSPSSETEPAGKSEQAAAPSTRRRHVRPLAGLIGLGALNALWAAFLWSELILARAGGKPFCAIGEGFDCGALWDGGFASAIHGATRMPVAGWGVIFGLICTALPLFALVKTAEGEESPPLLSALKVLAVGGLVGLVVLIGASAAAGTVCLGCLGTYLLVGLWAVTCLVGLKDVGFPAPGPGVGWAAGSALVGYLVLLYPGVSTPKPMEQAGRDAIAAAGHAGDHAGHVEEKGPSHNQHAAQQTQGPENPPPVEEPQDPAARVRAFLSSLPPQMQQAVSDSLYVYRTAKAVPVKTPRVVLGDPAAPLLITDFTDSRCGHCAQLHETLKEINKAVPPGSFKLEPRHFPLDGNCNPNIQRKAPDSVSCVSARAQICMEGSDKLFDFSGELFANGPQLNADLVMKIAAKYADLPTLQACMDKPETTQKLNDDIGWAIDHELEGTPLVLLNGKKATSFGPFLFAMILLGGDPNHPALSGLPPPQPGAHLH